MISTTSSLVDENRDRRVRSGIGNRLCHFIHDERVTDDQTQHPRPLATGLFAEDVAGIETYELHQIRRSD